jgi:hypothetical protein
MKFFLAIAVYLLIAAGLVWGIAALAIRGNPWVLILGLGAYLAGLVFIGCLPKKANW